MAEAEKRMIAACGLDCTDCDIRLVPSDAIAAARIVSWFKEKGWLEKGEGVPEIIERSMYCQGCHGDRAVHWSADCWILQCCVDEKGLRHCFQCDAFPCGRLEEWSKGNQSYTAALNRLREMGQTANA
jgi:hypothetical protein